MAKAKSWNENLPNTSTWAPIKPREDSRKVIQEGLRWTSRAAALRIKAAADAERLFNVHNFDSGAAVEDVVRQELRSLLPERYYVMAGVVCDAAGNSAGDCEVLIVNRFWAPLVKLPATSQSRRAYVPVEALYSVIEVKQTMTFDVLDQAIEKLVTVARLQRPDNRVGVITENTAAPGIIEEHQTDWTRSHLSKAVLAVYLGEASFRDLARRFFEINKTLNNNEKINYLCAIEGGLAFYISQANDHEINSVNYVTDKKSPKRPVILGGEKEDAFSVLVADLFGHCTRSVSDIADIHRRYAPTWSWEGMGPPEEP